MQRPRPTLLLALAVGLAASGAFADEERAIPTEHLQEVETSRRPARLIETPQAIGVVSREEFIRARPALDLEEALDLVPGVFAQSSRNFAQDTRVSIRGFGSRARFGIRGVRVLVDGVPNTLADGQSEVDSIELGFVERIEVSRGPISSLYGGGGGGILSLTTVAPTEDPTLSARTTFGTDHLSRYELLARGGAAGTGYVLGLARTRLSGYRDHARGEQSTLLAKLERPLGVATRARVTFSSVWAPEGQDPGGLNVAEVAADRSQARGRARTFDTGEKLNQQKLSLQLAHTFGAGREVRLTGYGLARDFSNALPFTDGGRVDLSRQAGGASLVYSDAWSRLQWVAGVDLDVQRDRRRRYDNVGGTRGPLVVRQSEQVQSYGPFAQGELALGDLLLVAGVRYDWTEFKVGDRFSADGDDSDTIRFRELSPRFGARYSFSPTLAAYGNVSTAFEVPTTTELRPAGAGGGFDGSLEPEKSLGVEVGLKGLVAGRFFFDAALFSIRVRDALVPFPDPTDPADEIFRNAGEIRRRGAELALSGELRPGASVRLGYTYADYGYHDFDTDGAEFDGNREPNNPRHSLGAELRLEHRTGAFAVLALRHFSDVETNDANTAEAGAATISDVRAGFDWVRDALRVRPFFGVRNWTGSEYSGTVRPNAGFGRYYEPAPEHQLYGGLEVEWSLRD